MTKLDKKIEYLIAMGERITIKHPNNIRGTYTKMEDFNKFFKDTTPRRLAQQIQNSPTLHLGHDYFMIMDNEEIGSFTKDVVYDDILSIEDGIVKVFTKYYADHILLTYYKEVKDA